MKERSPYQIGREALVAFLNFQTNFKVKGKENLPKGGPLIVAYNHPLKKTRLEYLVLPAVLPWKFTSLTLSAALYHPLAGKILTFCEMFGINKSITIRGTSGAEIGLRKAKKALSQGEIVVISPEGDGTRTGKLLRGKPGIAWLAEKTQAPILPLAIIINPNRKPSDILVPKRVEVEVKIGQLLYQKRPEGKPSRDWRQKQTDEVMFRIAALLPPAMRGYYSDIPKTLQIAP